MFRASLCPSSGAYQLQQQPLVYCRNVVVTVLLAVVGPVHLNVWRCTDLQTLNFKVMPRYVNCEEIKRNKRLREFIYFNPVACGRCSIRFHSITLQKTTIFNYIVNPNVGEVLKLQNDRPTNRPLSFLFALIWNI